MLILAIDTSAAQCAASIFDTHIMRETGRAVLDLGKGHAEHLMDVIETALSAAHTNYNSLGRIAVSVGPGSFTGVRVGVSTARGLALALGIPAVGISTLEAVAAATRDATGNTTVLAVFESAEDTLQAALYGQAGEVLSPPAIMALDQALLVAETHRPILAGTGAKRIAEQSDLPFIIGSDRNTADIAIYARLAATKGDGEEKPKPLYLREPDAKPQAGFVLPRA